MQRAFFLTSLLGGLALAGTIYFGLFNRLSETMLVQLSGLWFLPFVFGLYGLLGRMALTKEPEKTATGATAVAATGTAFALIIRAVARAVPPIISLGLILIIVLVGLPLFFIKNKHPLVMASVGVAMWAPLLVVFLVVIFPSL
jgi:hypothetical protein